MAGTANLKKQHYKNISKTTNLSRILHSIQVNISSCLWLQQLQIVDLNNNKCNTNDRRMKENLKYNCHNSSCTLDGIFLTINNCNIKKLKKKQQPTKQRPLTLNIAVIVTSLTILLIQMSTMVQSKSIYGESPAIGDEGHTTKTSAESYTKLLSSLSAETQHREHVSSLTDESSSASLDVLTSLDILRHIQRKQQHQRERRMRLRKRHAGDLIITNYLYENGHNLEWKNPCNMDYVNINILASHVTKQQVYQYLKKFERDVDMEYELISTTAHTININDMADWSKHDEIYKFLPKLNSNGSIALSRWYRSMQVYVASFAYLARAQYKFDQNKHMFVGRTSEELNKLLASARFILCELETTINGSAPNNNLKKLKTISRKSMNNRLNFVTKHQLANSNRDVVTSNVVDLKFAKFFYYQFLLNMQNILNHKLQNMRKIYGAI